MCTSTPTYGRTSPLCVGSCSSQHFDGYRVCGALPQHALPTVVRALVVSKVDYYCSTQAGVSGHLLDTLQYSLSSMLHSTCVFSKTSRQHQPLHRDLHRLPIPLRSRSRLYVLGNAVSTVQRCSALLSVRQSERLTLKVTGASIHHSMT